MTREPPTRRELAKMYYENGLNYQEIADKTGWSKSYIGKLMGGEGYGISPTFAQDKPWDDKENLENLYWDEGMSTREIAEELGVSRATIHHHMVKNDIPRRDRLENLRVNKASYRHNANGYPTWYCYVEGVEIEFRVHRLLGVAKYGIEEMKGKHIHHKNGVRWDNRPNNIEAVTPTEHAKIHYAQGDYKLAHSDAFDSDK